MAELPSNILLAREFARHIDGFSIGSNDLTQLTLGLDRDSALVAHLYDERNEAVKVLLRMLIRAAKECRVKVGICGQGPSDFPDFAQFLVEEGVDSISVTPDSFIKTVKAIGKMDLLNGRTATYTWCLLRNIFFHRTGGFNSCRGRCKHAELFE